MIAHKHICVHGTIKSLGQLGQRIQINAVVFIGEEAGRAIVAALDDVPGNAGKAQTGATGRGGRPLEEGISLRISENRSLSLFIHGAVATAGEF